MITFQVERWNQHSNVKVYRSREDVSEHAQKIRASYRNITDVSYMSRGLQHKRLRDNKCLGSQPEVFEPFSF